jgi:two-component system sensor histidine kinase KdpD
MASVDPDTRPDPDALIEAAGREGKGRLKIFLGAAPGVGKTWEMLAAARRLREEGHDVLAGVIETHGRAETEAQLGELPVLPRRPIAYRGQVLKEFDLDAALQRHPELLLIDELAHTNAPGSRHHKRWEDVAELLEAGIDIWATLNVQHLESLNDSVARITGVRVTETLPDKVMAMADEIELIDLPPAELRARLNEGRIYPAATARRALDGFFREGNLRALREIALRRAAEHVDADVTDYMRANAIMGPWPAGERVLAIVVGNERGGEAVVRHAKRLAEALHAPWIALQLEQAGRPIDGGSAMALASQLDAELEAIVGRDPIAATLALAQKRNVTQIVVGRGAPTWWGRLTGRTLPNLLVRRAPEFALHIVPLARDADRTPPPARAGQNPPLLAWVVAALLVGAVIALGQALRGVLDHEALGMVFLAAVVGSATLYGLLVGLFAAALGFLSWNFFFIPPLYRLSIESPRDIIAIFVFAGVAAATGALAGRVRAEAHVAQGRIENLRRIAGFSRRLGAPTTEPELLDEIARQAAGLAVASVVLTQVGEDLNIRAAQPPGVCAG